MNRNLKKTFTNKKSIDKTMASTAILRFKDITNQDSITRFSSNIFM